MGCGKAYKTEPWTAARQVATHPWTAQPARPIHNQLPAQEHFFGMPTSSQFSYRL